ncbi:hypothetical protein BLA60_11485 [Actinophytocola xinjiangensis]|jgi:hypothetical protein|uniref:Uncharacterized protein n=1 Tax=Actinophytocola xinjiangensis TaxID=485602 RepID=A0A7Z0WNZ8_9PSEU|nr:hypothetical protein [Actinophytocola xinjiangensis]OLF11569.1 hypothetical protein BLA60_11485 [Actinophytocola xinjiangensis]
MTAPQDGLHRTELASPGGRRLAATGVFHLRGAVYTVTFDHESALDTFLDLYLSSADDTKVARLHLTPEGTGLPAANLRFQLNLAHGVAAAVLIAMDADGRSHSWRTNGGSARTGVLLAHDTWHPDETALPPESFITTGQLRTVIAQWAFGEMLPPPAVEWVTVRDVGWF